MAKGKTSTARSPTVKGRGAKLKVFRTPIGFHDAYVAAPSQKAALEAWGTTVNLFARGTAEQVTDAKLMKAPLERPGEVIKVLRGSEQEQIKALGKVPAKGKRRGGDKAGAPPPTPPLKGRGERPSRAGVEKAEKALQAAEQRHAQAIARIKAEVEALERKRREAEEAYRAERRKLEEGVEEARERYSAAMAKWAGD